MAKSHPWLKRVYNEYNRAYFCGKLPGDAVVRWNWLVERDGCLGWWAIKEISLAPRIRFSRRWTRLVLLHEMAHMAVKDVGHGRRFLREIGRLLASGAYVSLL